MEGEASAPRGRRRRRRAGRPQGAPPAAAPDSVQRTVQVSAPEPPDPAPSKARRRRQPREALSERNLRDIVGAGHSQIGVSGALRARDVNRPTEDDLAAAENDVVIVRRNWKPPNPTA